MPVLAFVSNCPSKWARMHVLKIKSDDDNVPMLPRDARQMNYASPFFTYKA